MVRGLQTWQLTILGLQILEKSSEQNMRESKQTDMILALVCRNPKTKTQREKEIGALHFRISPAAA